MKEIGAGEAKEFKQAIFGGGVGFQCAIFEDVDHAKRGTAKVTANENEAVAGEGVFFAAHQGNAVGLDAATKALNTLQKQRQGNDAIVARLAGDVTFPFGAASAQFMAQEDVMEVMLSEDAFERFTIELRVELTVGLGTDIGDGGDAVLRQKLEKTGELVVGVTDGK